LEGAICPGELPGVKRVASVEVSFDVDIDVQIDNYIEKGFEVD